MSTMISLILCGYILGVHIIFWTNKADTCLSEVPLRTTPGSRLRPWNLTHNSKGQLTKLVHYHVRHQQHVSPPTPWYVKKTIWTQITGFSKRPAASAKRSATSKWLLWSFILMFEIAEDYWWSIGSCLLLCHFCFSVTRWLLKVVALSEPPAS